MSNAQKQIPIVLDTILEESIQEDDSFTSLADSNQETSDTLGPEMATGGQRLPYQPKIDPFNPKGIVDDAKQRNMFVNYQGDDNYALISRLCLPKKQSEPSKMVYKDKFNQRVQGKDEPAVRFVTELTRLANKCSFKDRDEQLLARVISGMRNTTLKEKLLAEEESTLKLEEVINRIYAAERAAIAAKDLSESSGDVNKIFKKQYGKAKKEDKPIRKRKIKCYRCGEEGHIKPECPMKNIKCFSCGREGHTSRVCTVKKKDSNHQLEEASTDEDAVEQEKAVNYLLRMEVQLAANKKAFLTIELNEKPLDMEVDSGATFSLIGRQTYDEYFPDDSALEESSVKMQAWGQDGIIRATGKVPVTVKLRDREAVQLELLVMDQEGPALIGRNWFRALGIEMKLPDVVVESAEPRRGYARKKKELPAIFRLDTVPSEFRDLADVFSPGLGKFKGDKIHVELKEGAEPKFYNARPVPFALREKVEKALTDLEEAKVIEKVLVSDWATPIVAVEKGSGVRICADFSATVNPQLKKATFPLPTLDLLLKEVKPRSKFAKIDLADAYLQFELDEESSKVMTINTHKGLFRFNRVPPGLAVAPPIFQKRVQGLLAGVPGVFVYFDDVFVFGRNEKILNARIRRVIETLKKHGLKLKLSKCEFNVSELEYLGYKFTEEGVTPTNEKIEAITKMRAPENVDELRAYLGLLKKDVPFEWTPPCQAAMDKVKGILSSAPVLGFYDGGKPLRLTTDGSRNGIGAVLSQIEDGKEVPLVFISRSLKRSEQNYSQLEIEALGVIWAIKKLKKYVWGRYFEIKTDHKPMIRIFGRGKPIPEDISAKLKRYCLFLRDFQYDIGFVPGVEIANADVLSRLPRPNLEGEEEEFEGECRIAFLLDVQGELNLKELQEETSKDQELHQVLVLLESGRHPSQLPEGCEEYVKRWQSLRESNGVVCFVDRAVVPRSLRDKVLKLLHLNHFGETKMKRLARQFFWWPRIDDDIALLCRSCQPCALVNRAPNQAPIIPWSVPHRPWSRVHLDFFEVGRGQSFIIAADGLSGWTDAVEVRDLVAKEAVAFCRRLFRFQGLCDVIVADNGPGFRAEEFKSFCLANGVELIFSPPYSPATNGVAERAVQTVKQFLKKTPQADWHQKLDSFLLGHNSTPRANGVAPSEYNLGRRPVTLLEKVHPDSAAVAAQIRRDRRAAQSVAKTTRIPNPGQPVTLRTHTNPKKKWAPGTLVRVLGPRRVQIRTQDGVLVERHTDQVKLHPPEQQPEVGCQPRNAGRPKRYQD